MSKKEIKILIIEDDEGYQLLFEKKLQGKYKIISAFTLEDVKKIFKENPVNYFDAIAVDAKLAHKFDTIPLIKEIINIGYNGILVGISGEAESNKELELRGCHYSCIKDMFPELIQKLIPPVNQKPLS